MALLHKMVAYPILWFCYKERDGKNVITLLYGGGVVEKVMVGGCFFSFLFYFIFLMVLLV
jgi:hypothetical protein